MPQLLLLCLHQRERCLLAECVSPALDSAHCYRNHRDRFSPDVKQCRSAGVHDHEPQRKWWMLFTDFQCQSRRSEWNWYLLAQNQQEAFFTACTAQLWSSLLLDAANGATGHLHERITAKSTENHKIQRSSLWFRNSLSLKSLKTGKVLWEYSCIPTTQWKSSVLNHSLS